ncbi:MAG: hypothetical protein Crog4KO_19460 [Crocinitomicaceae bacterium]
MKKQSAVFLQAYIQPDKIEALTELLNTGGNPLWPDSFFPFEKLETVHFARWIIAPKTNKFKASLIYSGNVDGSAEQHLEDLSKQFSEALDAILSHCEGYPKKEGITASSRLAYLQKHSFKTPTFYVGAPNRTVSQIRNEAKLHKAVKNYVRENRSEWRTGREAYHDIQRFLEADPQWDWARNKYELPKKKPLKMLLAVLLILVLLPFLMVLVLLIFLFYELPSKSTAKTINEISVEKMAKLQEHEDIIYQNQLSQVFETKSGLRKLMLHLLLWVTNYGAKNWFVKGQLFGTPTIHFARWVFIDGGKRFVFFSNFDGTYDGYLSDFVDNNGWGLNAIYGAAKGYPKTFFVFGGGSYRFLKFLGWGRQTQVATPIWYSAYPWSSLPQIINKSELRVALFSDDDPSDEEIDKLLHRI